LSKQPRTPAGSRPKQKLAFEPDKTDKQILNALQDDARISVADLARLVGLGETAVRHRISRMTKANVITKFTALLSPREIGYTVSAILILKVEAKRLQFVFDRLAAREEASHIIQTSGEHDMVAVIHAKNMDHLNTLVSEIRGIAGVIQALVWIATGLVKIDPKFHLR
jgi:DNA-binding Lrp family transcriptional regulator